jgi:hypothetical protein
MFSEATFKNGGKAVQYCLEHISYPLCHVLVVEIGSWKVLRHYKKDSSGGGYIHFSEGGEFGCVLDSHDGGMLVFDFKAMGSCEYPVQQEMIATDITEKFKNDLLRCHVHHPTVKTSLYEDPDEDHPCTCDVLSLHEQCEVIGHKGDLSFVRFFPKKEEDEFQFLATGGTDKAIMIWKLSGTDAEFISTQTFDDTPTSITFITDPTKDPARRIAFSMGLHDRLGDKSAVSVLSSDVLHRLIFKQMFSN